MFLSKTKDSTFFFGNFVSFTQINDCHDSSASLLAENTQKIIITDKVLMYDKDRGLFDDRLYIRFSSPFNNLVIHWDKK